MTNKQDVPQNFQEAFVVAMGNPENSNPDGFPNWDFVDADVYEAVGSFFSGVLYNKYFDMMADGYEA